MKKFEELTDIEVYGLTTEEVNNYRKLAMAMAGVQFPVAPQSPEKRDWKPDTVVYTIDGLSDKWNHLCFSTIEAARAFVKMILELKDFGYIGSSNVDYKIQLMEDGLPKGWNGDMPSLNIQAVPVFSHKVYGELEKDMRAYKAKTNEYENQMKDYKELRERAEKVTSPIDERVRSVHEDMYKKECHYHRLINDYLPLAENNLDIALGFLDKAYGLSDSDKDYIRERYESESAK